MTFIPVTRCKISTIMPLCVGSRCWTITKAMPLSSGTCFRNCSIASRPPAEAPMPTMGKPPLLASLAALRGRGLFPDAAFTVCILLGLALDCLFVALFFVAIIYKVYQKKQNRKIVMQTLFGVTEVFFGAGGRNKGLLYITV